MNYKETKNMLIHHTDTKIQDGTYTIEVDEGSFSIKQVAFNTGFQVSFETKKDTYTEDQYNHLVARLKKAHGEVYVGVYQGELEFSFHIDNFEEAMRLGSLFNQYSIWDWSKGCEVVLWGGKC